MNNAVIVEPVIVKTPLLTEEQAVEYFRGAITKRLLQKWRTEKTGPSWIKIGIKVFYKLEALEIFVEEQTRVMAG